MYTKGNKIMNSGSQMSKATGMTKGSKAGKVLKGKDLGRK